MAGNMVRRDFLKAAGYAGLVAAGAVSASRGHAATADVMPPGAIDTHNHIMGPQAKYPYVANRAYTPPEATVADLRALRAQLGVSRNVIVSPTVYGFDMRCTADAIAELGESARGVAVVSPQVTDAELAKLKAQRFVGARLNTGMPAIADVLSSFASRFKPLGLHIQIVGALPTLVPLMPKIADLPVPVVLDHFGGASAEGGTSNKDFQALLELVRGGNVHVKLSAPYDRSKRADYADVTPLARALIEARPDRMLWGTNWPHPNQDRSIPISAISPYQKIDNERLVRAFAEWCPDQATRRRILVENPENLYGFAKV